MLRTNLCVKKLKLYFLKSKNSDRLNESVNEEVGNCSIRTKKNIIFLLYRLIHQYYYIILNDEKQILPEFKINSYNKYLHKKGIEQGTIKMNERSLGAKCDKRKRQRKKWY